MTAVAPQTHASKFRAVRFSVAISLLSLVLASCAAAPASSVGPSSAPASFSPSATPAETASTDPTASEPEVSAPPSAGALVVPDIAVGDYLEVTGNGLAVRSGPGAQHPLVSEWLRTGIGDGLEITHVRDDVRLPAGYVVRAWLGPLVVDDTAWYAVGDVPQAGEPTTADSLRIWRTVSPAEDSEIDFQLTWIAVAQPGATLVRATERPATECPCFGDYPGPTVIASGVGEGRVGPWTNVAGPWITVAAAAPSSTDTCEFRVLNQDGDPVFFDESAVDYLQGQIPGVMPAADAGPDAELWLDILGDCAWAVTVQLPQG